MWNFLKNLFTSTQKNLKATGSFLNDVDVRDINALDVYPEAVQEPNFYETDITMLPVFNQKMLGTCVAQAFTLYKMYLDYLETGKVVEYSRRFLYAISRRFANMIDNSQQGLQPRTAAKVLVNIGVTKESDYLDTDTLTHQEYVEGVVLDKKAREEANIYKSKGYAFVGGTDTELTQALLKFKLVAVSLPYDPQTWLDWFIHRVKTIFGFHYILVYGYEKIGTQGLLSDTEFRFRNSWGVFWGLNGYGKFRYSEYKGQIRDCMVLTDLPNDILERAKQAKYIFLTDLKKGMQGEAVTQLQKRLQELGLIDTNPTGYFGELTFRAVVEFQKLNGLPATGYFGPLSRTAMNGNDKNTQKTTSKIDKWCEAIGKMEGAKPELHNLGNIKYIGQKTAVGKDYRGFCIFPDDATGYLELRNLLVRAATGKSKVYNPDMTLVDFYHVYAPSNDGNNPDHYAKFVAQYIGVTPDTKIKELL